MTVPDRAKVGVDDAGSRCRSTFERLVAGAQLRNDLVPAVQLLRPVVLSTAAAHTWLPTLDPRSASANLHRTSRYGWCLSAVGIPAGSTVSIGE